MGTFSFVLFQPIVAILHQRTSHDQAIFPSSGGHAGQANLTLCTEYILYIPKDRGWYEGLGLGLRLRLGWDGEMGMWKRAGEMEPGSKLFVARLRLVLQEQVPSLLPIISSGEHHQSRYSTLLVHACISLQRPPAPRRSEFDLGPN